MRAHKLCRLEFSQKLFRRAADAIGMSGLLVKSTIIMKDNLEVLNEHGVTPPIILGGAALTRKYVEQDLTQIYQGKLGYARDAFDGLHFMQALEDGNSGRPFSFRKSCQRLNNHVQVGGELDELGRLILSVLQN